MAERAVELFLESIGRFADLVDGIDDGRWTAPTPSADWDVRTLVDVPVGGPSQGPEGADPSTARTSAVQ